MSTIKVRKLKIASNDAIGFKISRYEKMEVAFGTVLAAAYTIGDTLSFAEVPASVVVSATFITADTTPIVVQALNITDFTTPVPVNVTSGTAVDISYRIEYIRGPGKSTPFAILTS